MYRQDGSAVKRHNPAISRRGHDHIAGTGSQPHFTEITQYKLRDSVSGWHRNLGRTQVVDQAVGFGEGQPRVDGGVANSVGMDGIGWSVFTRNKREEKKRRKKKNVLHREGLVGSGSQLGVKIWVNEDDSIFGISAPNLHQVDHVSEPERRVASKDYTGRPKGSPKRSIVDILKFVEAACLGKVSVEERGVWNEDFALSALGHPLSQDVGIREAAFGHRGDEIDGGLSLSHGIQVIVQDLEQLVHHTGAV